jgi:photosystem II stability/assembly factor-like uncharacterized protein
LSEKTKTADKNTQRETASEKTFRSPLLIWGALAVFVIALAAGASYLLSGGTGSDAGSRGEAHVGGDFHSLAVDPTNPEKVMVGGHEGAAMSDDGGVTWRQIPDLEGSDPMGWVIDTQDPSKMYAGGHPGFFRSGDGGESWSMNNSNLPGTDVHALGIDPQNPETLYAFIVERGLYRSPDAGESWELVNAQKGTMGPILVDPRQSDTLYLVGQDGLESSDDGGESWRRLGAIPGGMTMSISQDQQEPDTFYAAAGGRVLKSTDGGESWQPTGNEGLPEGVSVVAVSPSDPQVLYAGVLDGESARVFRSEDGGESWQAQN